MRLERNKFKTWLEAKPPAYIVGHNRDCHACPIAQFYLEASGGCEVVIANSGGVYTIDRGDGDRRLPFWAANFAFSVDDNTSAKITARRALEILTSCT